MKIKFNGYDIQDLTEVLRQQLNAKTLKLSGINKYFASEGPADSAQIDTLVGEIEELEYKSAKLSTLQLLYNTSVIVPELDMTLQQAIKTVGVNKRMMVVWSNLQTQAKSCAKGDSYFGYREVEEEKKREWPQSIYSVEECQTEIDWYAGKLRDLKRYLRTANAIEIDIPKDYALLFE